MPVLDILFCTPKRSGLAKDSNRCRDAVARWDVIYDIARERGHRVRVSNNEALPEDLPGIAGSGVIVFHSNANWYPAALRSLLGRETKLRPLSVIWHSEPLPAPREANLPMQKLYRREVKLILLRSHEATDIYSNALHLKRLARRNIPDLMLVSSQDRCDYLAERGILAHRAPVGYASLLPDAPPPNNADDARDIDVLFIGAQSLKHRKQTVQELKNAGINTLSLGDYNKDSLWGDERDHLIRRAKIFLNLHRYPAMLPGMRFLIGMTNRALVVSEPLYKPAPYLPGENLVESPRGELAATLHRYLNDHAERERIADNGYEFSRQMTTRHAMTRIIECLEERFAEYLACQRDGRVFERGPKLKKTSAKINS